MLYSAMIKLIAWGGNVSFLPQSLYEIWVVVTRPKTQNGYGGNTVRTDQWIQHTLTFGKSPGQYQNRIGARKPMRNRHCATKEKRSGDIVLHLTCASDW